MTFAYLNPYIFGGATYASVPFWENLAGRQRLQYNNGSYTSFHLHRVFFSNQVPWNKPFMIAMNQGADTAIISLTMSLGLYTRNGTSFGLVNSASGSVAGSTSSTWASWFSFATSASSNITPGEYWLGVIGTNGATTSGAVMHWGGNAMVTGNSIHSTVGVSTASNNSLPATVAASNMNWDGGVRPRYIVISA